MSGVRLETMTAGDVELRLRLETDPVAMAHLGGPRPRADIERAHALSVVEAAAGECWPLKVFVDDADGAVGSVSVFRSMHGDAAIYEIGWMILPQFHNRGVASEAVRQVLERARAEHKFGRLHAFPATMNAASNRICEKNGFQRTGEVHVEFAGHSLHCNHWVIDLDA